MSKDQASKKASLWVWIPLGLALGCFVAFILFLDGKKQASHQNVKAVAKKPHEKPDRAKPVFDFYTVLPDRVLEIEQNIETDDASGIVLKAKPRIKQKYILQVGSFSNFADADGLKAQLAFLGLEAKLAEANIKNSRWYRVQLGPFSSSSSLSNTKNLLIQNKIKYLQKNAS